MSRRMKTLRRNGQTRKKFLMYLNTGIIMLFVKEKYFTEEIPYDRDY